MEQNRIIILIAAALMILDIIWFVIRGVKNGFNGVAQRTKAMLIGIFAGYIAAVAMLVIFWFREFGIFSDIILCGCAVLAVELENRQLLGITGSYEESDSTEG